MPRVELRPEDEPAIVALVTARLSARGGSSTVRDLGVFVKRAGFPDLKLSEMYAVCSRAAGVEASEDGRVRSVQTAPGRR